MPGITLFLVDDNFVVRRGLRSVLEQEEDMEVVGEASTGREALDQLKGMDVDVVLLDIRMPDLDGIAVARQLAALSPQAAVLMVTVQDDPVHLVQAMLAGARGYLVYGRFSPEEVVGAVRTVTGGGVVITPSLAPVLLELVREGTARDLEDPDPLTRREREILMLIAGGMSNREVGARLGVEEKTVKNHLSNVYAKLRLKGRYEAIAYALQRGIGPQG